jgi:hypothetical protein
MQSRFSTASASAAHCCVLLLPRPLLLRPCPAPHPNAATHQAQAAGADIVVALTHMRAPNDVQLAQQVAEIDVVLGGHDHFYTVRGWCGAAALLCARCCVQHCAAMCALTSADKLTRLSVGAHARRWRCCSRTATCL